MDVTPIVTTAGIEPAFDLSASYPIFLYGLAIVGFAVSSLMAAALIGPKKPTAVKLMPYESGMDPIGDARMQFDVKFYLIAILFLVFDVELVPVPVGGDRLRRRRGRGLAAGVRNVHEVTVWPFHPGRPCSAPSASRCAPCAAPPRSPSPPPSRSR